MVTEVKVPSRVVESHVEFDESWIFMLVAPCKLPILKVDFLQIAVRERVLPKRSIELVR